MRSLIVGTIATLLSVLIKQSSSAICKSFQVGNVEIALDYCVNGGSTGSSYKFTCNNDKSSVQIAYYNEQGCVGPILTTSNYSGPVDSFNCDLSMCNNNQIAKVAEYLGQCNPSGTASATLFYVTGSCITYLNNSYQTTCMNQNNQGGPGGAGNITISSYMDTLNCNNASSMLNTIFQYTGCNNDNTAYTQVTCNAPPDPPLPPTTSSNPDISTTPEETFIPDPTILLNYITCTQYVGFKDSPLYAIGVCQNIYFIDDDNFGTPNISLKFSCVDNANDSSLMLNYYSGHNCNSNSFAFSESVLDADPDFSPSSYKCGDPSQACSYSTLKLYNNCTNDYIETAVIRDICFPSITNYGNSMKLTCANNGIIFETYNDQSCCNYNNTFNLINGQCVISPFDNTMSKVQVQSCGSSNDGKSTLSCPSTSTPTTTKASTSNANYYSIILSIIIISIISMIIM